MILSIVGAAGGGQLASFDWLGLVLQAGPIVKLVLLLLAALSIISWAIIAYKWRELSGAMQDSEAFLEVYHEEALDAAHEAARHLDRSPLSAIFLATAGELKRLGKQAGRMLRSPLDPDQLRQVERRIAWSASQEARRLERGLSFLATTGSSAPFIGLFGTVIGIIQSFHSIAQAGSASLAVVAPGIAEALIATAAGLLAAIPATIFYNAFVARVAAINESIDVFAGEFEKDLGRRVRGPESPPVRATGGGS